MNVLYDKDHYKLALGQVNIARHKVDEFVFQCYALLTADSFCRMLHFCEKIRFIDNSWKFNFILFVELS